MNSSNNTILIIEDNKEISSMLSEFFIQNSFIPSVAANGPTGLKMALSGSYNCVLLVLMLPYKSGDEVLKELRAGSDVPVIVLSAKGLTQNKIDLCVWGEQYTYDNDTINTHISNLRKKLDSNVIKTIWGMGYKVKLGSEGVSHRIS